jgi:hypothetical protein
VQISERSLGVYLIRHHRFVQGIKNKKQLLYCFVYHTMSETFGIQVSRVGLRGEPAGQLPTAPTAKGP